MNRWSRTLALAAVGWLVAIPGPGFPDDEAGRFTSVVLGAGGGLAEDNLSAYLLAPAGSTDFIALDAGTLFAGLQKTRDIQRSQIHAYLISHPHLDHVAGLVINSPEDGSKDVIGLPATIDSLRDHLFNWEIWPNFGSEGQTPHLGQYRYVRVNPGQVYPIAGTSMTVEPFVLSHRGSPSTAFLIQAGKSYALYFGDTGPDAIETGEHMKGVWTRVAPLVRSRQLAGVFLEVSYPDGRPDDQLFGHLTPSWMMRELHELASIVNPEHPTRALHDLTVIVTHIKPAEGSGRQIAQELEAQNDLGVHFVVPEQGQRIEF